MCSLVGLYLNLPDITNLVMKVKVSWIGKTKEIETASKTVSEMLKEMKINSEIVLVSVNNEIVPDDSPIKENDHIEILKVVSGG